MIILLSKRYFFVNKLYNLYNYLYCYGVSREKTAEIFTLWFRDAVVFGYYRRDDFSGEGQLRKNMGTSANKILVPFSG